jgi:hypothetical protein
VEPLAHLVSSTRNVGKRNPRVLVLGSTVEANEIFVLPTSLGSVEDGGYLSRRIVVWCQLERPGIGVRVEIGWVIRVPEEKHDRQGGDGKGKKEGAACRHEFQRRVLLGKDQAGSDPV